jgi:hypothetical protein
VEVTPPSAGSLTLVVTLTTGTVPVPAGVVAAAEGPAEAAVSPAAPGAVVSVAATAVAVAAAHPADPAGSEEGRQEVAEAEPRPAEDGPDLQEKLRGIDLYQPTADPDRPGQVSGRPAGQRDRVVLAQAPVAPADPLSGQQGPRAIEVLGAAAPGDREAPPTEPEVADVVFLRPPAEWRGLDLRVLMLAGLALVPWPDLQGDEPKPEDKRRRWAMGVVM